MHEAEEDVVIRLDQLANGSDLLTIAVAEDQLGVARP